MAGSPAVEEHLAGDREAGDGGPLQGHPRHGDPERRAQRQRPKPQHPACDPQGHHVPVAPSRQQGRQRKQEDDLRDLPEAHRRHHPGARDPARAEVGGDHLVHERDAEAHPEGDGEIGQHLAVADQVEHVARPRPFPLRRLRGSMRQGQAVCRLEDREPRPHAKGEFPDRPIAGREDPRHHPADDHPADRPPDPDRSKFAPGVAEVAEGHRVVQVHRRSADQPVTQHQRGDHRHVGRLPPVDPREEHAREAETDRQAALDGPIAIGDLPREEWGEHQRDGERPEDDRPIAPGASGLVQVDGEERPPGPLAGIGDGRHGREPPLHEWRRRLSLLHRAIISRFPKRTPDYTASCR